MREVELGEFDHRVTFEREGGEETVSCRWVLDATGRATFLGKRLGLIERNREHPTAAVWCRWEGVRHLDDVAARGPLSFARGNVTSRRLATNHYMGFGYWVWFIPLGNGETSIGIVFDTRLVDLDRGKNMASDYLAFLRAIPQTAELLEGASMKAEDLRTYSNLAYSTRQYMGKGWALMGDAAAFLDPYYSPGLDHASFSVEATVEIVKAADGRGGRCRPYRRAQRTFCAPTTGSSRRSIRTSTSTWASTTCSRPRSSSIRRSTTSSW